MREQASNSPEVAHLERRIEILDEIGHLLFDRAWWLRGTLVCLLISVLCMLVCSPALGLSPLGAGFAVMALVSFVAGEVAMMLGVLLAIQELRLALTPLLFEHERMEQW